MLNKLKWVAFFTIPFFLLFAFIKTDAKTFEVNEEDVEHLLRRMTLEEKIGQLFMVAAYSNSEDATKENQSLHPIEHVEQLIRNFHVGGVLLKGRWEPLRQVHYVDYFQSLSSIPLFIAQDCEWGLAMRHANGQSFPKNITLGAVQDLSLIQELGKEMGRQCRLVGINWNFAPVVDVNSEPRNPVIGKRSFGDDPHQVAERGAAFMQGLQEMGVISSAKHFPGHGNTTTDSHLSLPTVSYEREQVERMDLFPFREMIAAGVKSIMVAHVAVPALDGTGVPATLSSPIVHDLLRQDLQFKGLVVTDDLIMGAISQQFPGGEALLKAFQAGNDILLSSHHVAEGFEILLEAVQNGVIKEEELDGRVRRILLAKQWLLQEANKGPQMLSEEGEWDAFETEKGKFLKQHLFEEAITLVQGSVPLQKEGEWHLVQIGGEYKSPFFQVLHEGMAVKRHFLGGDASSEEIKHLWKKIPKDAFVIAALYPSIGRKGAWGTIPTEVAEGLNQENTKMMVIFDSPYILRQISVSSSILMAYEEDPDAQIAAARVLLGEVSPKGKLPVKF